MICVVTCLLFHPNSFSASALAARWPWVLKDLSHFLANYDYTSSLMLMLDLWGRAATHIQYHGSRNTQEWRRTRLCPWGSSRTACKTSMAMGFPWDSLFNAHSNWELSSGRRVSVLISAKIGQDAFSAEIGTQNQQLLGSWAHSLRSAFPLTWLTVEKT